MQATGRLALKLFFSVVLVAAQIRASGHRVKGSVETVRCQLGKSVGLLIRYLQIR
jgi:hypothetical protein